MKLYDVYLILDEKSLIVNFPQARNVRNFKSL